MKPHIFFSPESGTGTGATEPVKRLAARYNIPEKDVEALLYGSRAPKGAQEGSSIKDTTMPEDFRPNYGGPQRERGWSPITVLSLVVGVLGVMALTIILIAVLRNDRGREREHEMMMRERMMMMPPMHPPMRQQDTMPAPAKPSQSENAIPEDNTPAPSAQNEMAKPAPKHHSTSHTSGYVTTNSLEAQEHLAEMRAEGNTKARIHESTKNGMTIYTVR